MFSGGAEGSKSFGPHLADDDVKNRDVGRRFLTSLKKQTLAPHYAAPWPWIRVPMPVHWLSVFRHQYVMISVFDWRWES